MGAGASLQTAQLLDDIRGRDSSARHSALTEVLTAVNADERIPAENIRDIKLIPVLVDPLVSKDAKARELAIEIFLKLALDPEIRVLVRDQEPRLKPLILQIAEKEDGKIFAKSCRLCGRLGYMPDISLRRLVQSLNQDGGNSLIITCEALWGLSVLPMLRGPMSSPDLRLVEGLSTVCNMETNNSRLYACSALVNISCDAKCRENLLRANTFLSTMIKLLTPFEPYCLKSINGACGILRNMATTPANKVALAAPDAKLVSTIASLLLYDFTSAGIAGGEWLKVVSSGCSLLSALASCPASHAEICSQSTDVLTALSTLLQATPEHYCGSNVTSDTAVNLAEAKDFACIALCHLSAVVSNQKDLLTGRYSLLDNLVSLLTAPPADRGNARYKKLIDPRLNSCLVLSNMAVGGTTNCELMMDAGLVTAVVSLLNDFSRGTLGMVAGSTVDFDEDARNRGTSSIDIKLVVGVCEVLKHLAVEESNKFALLQEDIRLIPALVAVLNKVTSGPSDGPIAAWGEEGDPTGPGPDDAITRGKQAIIEIISTIIWYLATGTGSGVLTDINLLEALVDVLTLTTGSAAHITVCSAIACVSSDPENSNMLVNPDLGLIAALVMLIGKERNSVRIHACAIISNLSLSSNNKVMLADPSLGVVGAMVTVLMEDFGEARINACSALQSLSVSVINKIRMTAANLGLMDALVKVIKRDKGKAREYACSTASNIAVAPDNKVFMGRSDIGLFRALSGVLMDDTGASRGAACAALNHLATASQNKIRMLRPELGLITAFKKVLNESSGAAALFAGSALNHISMSNQNKTYLGSPTANLFPTIVATLKKTGDRKLESHLCSCLANLALAVENRVTIADDSLGVIDCLVHVLHTNRGKAMRHSSSAIRSLSVAAENKVLLAQEKYGLVRALVAVMREVRYEPRSNACFTIWNLAVNPQNQVTLLAADNGLLEAFSYILMDPKTDEKTSANATGAILNFTISSENETLMLEPKYNLLQALVYVLNSTIKGKSKEYTCSAVSNLAFVVENKKKLISPSLGVLAALSKLIKEAEGNTLNHACLCLSRLAVATGNRTTMASPDLGILTGLVHVLKGEVSEARDFACLTLSYLSDCVNNRILMIIPKLGLLTSLSKILETDTGKARVYACATIKNLSVAADTSQSVSEDHASEALPPLIAALTAGSLESRETASSSLANLAHDESNKVSMINPELKLVETLLQLLQDYSVSNGGSDRVALNSSGGHVYNSKCTEEVSEVLAVNACNILWGLADLVTNRVHMCSVEVGLVKQFATLLQQPPRVLGHEVRADLCGILRSLSVANENKIVIADRRWGLVQQLINILTRDDDYNSLHEYICAILSNIAIAPENKIALAEPTLGMFPALVRVLVGTGGRRSEDGARVAACAALHFMACYAGNLTAMASSELGILSALISVLCYGKSDCRSNACSALCHIASAAQNRVKMNAPELGLLPALITVMTEDTGKSRIFACSTIGFLAVAPENQKAMATLDNGLLQVLVKVILEDGPSGKCREYACSATRSLSAALGNKVIMASRDVGLLKALVVVLMSSTAPASPIKGAPANTPLPSNKARSNACATICNLANATSNKVLMADVELGLLPALIYTIRNDAGEARVNACAALSYLAVPVENKPVMLDYELGLMAALKTVIREDAGKARVNACLTLSNLSVGSGTGTAAAGPPVNDTVTSPLVPKNAQEPGSRGPKVRDMSHEAREARAGLPR